MENIQVLPTDKTKKKSHLSSFEAYQKLYQESILDRYAFWKAQAQELLVWKKKFSVVDGSDLKTGEIKWFEDGALNVCENCVDRHLPEKANKVALIWESDEPGITENITYQTLYNKVCQVANVLKSKGVAKGDKVAIYMPMIPEAIYTMLACARIGAAHSVVFAGFSADSLRDRINDAQCKVVVTADEGLRGQKVIPLKKTVDQAIAQCASVSSVIVAKRTGNPVPFDASKDCWLQEEMSKQPRECEPEEMNAEDTLFLLYTSGSTGKPKGIAHSNAGYLLYATITHKYIFDIQDDDVYACVADIGWITGHSYVVYGPLSNGTTTVVFESVPHYPDAGRYWDMVERLKITQFYTAPTAIRAIQREGDSFVKKYDRSSLRVLGSVGEPINPDTWKWYHEVVGEKECSVVDTWWQTETGGVMITPLPGATPMKPGSATFPFFGVEPVILDNDGKEVDGNGVSGLLAIKKSWPGMARTIYGDHERFLNTYLKPFEGYYFTGDGSTRDVDGYYWITGRVDDVMNVSGHRMGSAEVENALVSHEGVSESAVVGFPHDIKGEGIFAYVILKEGVDASDTLVQELRNLVRQQIGPIATPDFIMLVPGLPKTRSGKIMRRILRKIASSSFDELGDTTTLADPSIVDKLKALRKVLA